MEGQRPRISIVGAGNVAANLAPALDAVADVVCVFSRNQEKARCLGARLRNAVCVNDLRRVDTDVDVVIVSVADDAVAEVSSQLPVGRAVVAHTSGSVPMQAIAAPRRGVFYALQTFSRDKAVDFSQIPFFIEASDENGRELLFSLARSLSHKVFDADSEHRAALHVAAVLACNFANYLWDEADALLRPYGYDLTVFAPLLRETLEKAIVLGPHKSQTGPAMRRDYNVIEQHKAKLSDDLSEVYDLLTKRIMAAHADQ